MRRCTMKLCAVALVVAGCAAGDVRSELAAVRDSGGVLIVENRSDLATNLLWQVQAAPVLELGRADGVGPDVFGSVRHAIRLRMGEIAVADATAREIRVFDEAGQHLRTFGRQGEGPGEFTNLWWIAEARGDSIAAVDNLNARVSLFTHAGEFSRSYAIPRIPGGSAPNVQGIMHSSTLVVSTRAVAVPSTAGQSAVLVYTVDPDGNISAQLGEYQDRELGRNGLGLGFGGVAVLAVSDSVVWYAHSNRFEIRAFDPQGSLLRIIRLERTPRAVTDDDIAEARAAVQEDLRRQGASGLAFQRILDTEFAATHPVLGPTILDDTGYLWVARYRNRLVGADYENAEPETWDVFDPGGRLRGYVALPGSFRVTEIRENFLLGVHTDPLGVQRVRLYGIDRD